MFDIDRLEEALRIARCSTSRYRSVQLSNLLRGTTKAVVSEMGYYEHPETGDEYPYIIYSTDEKIGYPSLCLGYICAAFPERVCKSYEECNECQNKKALTVLGMYIPNDRYKKDDGSYGVVLSRRYDYICAASFSIGQDNSIRVEQRSAYVSHSGYLTISSVSGIDSVHTLLQSVARALSGEAIISPRFMNRMIYDRGDTCYEQCGKMERVEGKNFSVSYTGGHSESCPWIYVNGDLHNVSVVRGPAIQCIEEDDYFNIHAIVYDDYICALMDMVEHPHVEHVHRFAPRPICFAGFSLLKTLVMSGLHREAAILFAHGLSQINSTDMVDSYIVDRLLSLCDHCEEYRYNVEERSFPDGDYLSVCPRCEKQILHELGIERRPSREEQIQNGQLEMLLYTEEET